MQKSVKTVKLFCLKTFMVYGEVAIMVYGKLRSAELYSLTNEVRAYFCIVS